MTPKINLVFMGGFTYPHGMAGTKRIQHVINGLKTYADLSIHVLVLRQSSQHNPLTGVYQGIHYETVMGDLLRMKMVLMAPLLHLKAKLIIKHMFKPGQSNIIYVYGPPSFDNLSTIKYARRHGFKVVFDIVEDDDLARDISKSPWHYLSNAYKRHATRKIASLADGIVVISMRIEEKIRKLTLGAVPVHLLPISVDMDRYPEAPQRFGVPVTLFYAGSFGKKDGVPILLDGFDTLAAKHANVRLVMTGRGTDEVMRKVYECIAASPYKERIIYRGYLDDTAYYAALRDADILCMPRIDIGYAQAGFPFKLGEYLATGKPVITSAVSDIPSLLKDRHDAMLVIPGNSAAIAEAAEILINDQKNAFAVGARGRAIARCLFDYRSQSKELRSFLYRVALR